MECRRCQGLMVEDHFLDFEGPHGFMWMKGWRCMNCAYMADAVGETNRRLHEATVLVRTSEEVESEKAYVDRRAETVTRSAA